MRGEYIAEYVKTSRSKAALFILYKYMFVLYSMGVTLMCSHM